VRLGLNWRWNMSAGLNRVNPQWGHFKGPGVMDQTRRAEGMFLPFGPELTVRHSAKVLIDQRKEWVERARVAGS
jgi:hypothetical protein